MFNKLKILKKMKIKNLKLMLVSAFLIMGSNAFAVKIQKAAYNGVRYEYDADQAAVGTDPAGSATNPFKATVVGVINDATSLEFKATFTKVDENDKTLNFAVIGFAANWAKATGEKDVTATLTSLTIDAKNMGNLSNAFTGLTKLAKLTVSSDNASWTNEGYVTGHLALSDAIKTIEELDLSGLTKVETLAGDFKVSGDNWKKLTKLSLPANLTAIPANCFQDSKVTDLTFTAAKLATIGDAAFKGAALTSIDLSETKVTVIPASAFFEAKALATVTLPADLTEIGAAAFYTTALTSIAIPEKVTTVGAWAFEKCEALATVTGMTKVEEIKTATFRGCKALTAFEVPATVTSIGDDAFKGCEALATFTFATRAADGAALASIGASAFDGCKALTAIDLSSEKFTFNVIKSTWFVGCEALKEIKLSKNIIGIQDDAFADCVIEELDLSVCETLGKLRTIFGAHDAKNPNPLKSIILPDALTEIVANVFDYSALTEITLPASLTVDIPAQAFYYCDKLKTVNYMPEAAGSTVYINEEAFLGCTPFVKINTNSYYFSDYPWALSDEPTNATFGATEDLAVTPVQDKANKNNYFAKICPTLDIQISKKNLGEAKLYSVYVDEGIAYFQALKVMGGNYVIAAGQHAILKAKSDATVEFEIGFGGGSVQEDHIFSFKETVKTADFQANSKNTSYGHLVDPSDPDSWVWDFESPYKYSNGEDVVFNAGTDYIYALTNSKKNGGFGFTYYTGATMPADAFFILSDLVPSKAGRLETVWLDENGNVEGEATAINKIQSKTEDGAIYNLQGVRVNAAKKGIYIQNGKKYIMK